jgi:DNA polymerase-3 subunit alpha
MVESAEVLLNSAARNVQERESGQTSLFGGPSQAEGEVRLPAVAEWPPHERLNEEFNAIGFYLSGHPLDAYAAALKRLGAVDYATLLEDRRRSGFRVVLAGTVIRKQERRGRNDQPFGFVSLSDPTGMFEVMVFSEALAASRPLLEPGKAVLVAAGADWDGEELKLRALTITDLAEAAAQAGEGLRVRLDDASALGAIAGQLRQPGKGIVTLVVPGGPGEEVEIALPKRHQVTMPLKEAIRSIPGVTAVESV